MQLLTTHSSSSSVCIIAALLACLCSPRVQVLHAESPLRRQIDEHVRSAATKHDVAMAARADDVVFLRRLMLDVTGRIPTAKEAKAFAAEPAPDKREQLVGQLLSSPEHARQLQRTLDRWLMRRVPAKHVSANEWQQYLFEAAKTNKSWRQLTRELLGADGTNPKTRPAARFLLDRELKVEDTVRDIGRVFLGRDLQCAQCHDHPNLEDYRQRHFFGIAAFLNRTYLFKDPALKKTTLGEKAEGEVKFTSVFTGEEGVIAPRLLDLREVFDPPIEDPTAIYRKKPDKKTRGEPMHSRRALLAAEVTSARNRDFRINLANRVWAMAMGRGLIEPLDMIHADSPCEHPELLELLADHLVATDYNIRDLLQEILLSETYQQSSVEANQSSAELPEGLFVGARLKPLSPHQLALSTMIATGIDSQWQDKIRAKVNDPWQFESELSKLQSPHLNTFAKVFDSGNETGAFDATASQALFMRNGKLLSQWTSAAANGLVASALETSMRNSPAEAVREVYWAVYGRSPDATELANAVAFVSSVDAADAGSVSGSQQREAMGLFVRALLCSAEFRLNH